MDLNFIPSAEIDPLPQHERESIGRGLRQHSHNLKLVAGS